MTTAQIITLIVAAAVVAGVLIGVAFGHAWRSLVEYDQAELQDRIDHDRCC